jgi:hypothetical protein
MTSRQTTPRATVRSSVAMTRTTIRGTPIHIGRPPVGGSGCVGRRRN